MLKFVSKWTRQSQKDDECLDTNEWIKCDEGLPQDDCQVEVLSYCRDNYDENRSKMKISFGCFSPFTGWNIVTIGTPYCWRYINEETKRIIKDIKSVKKSLGN